MIERLVRLSLARSTAVLIGVALLAIAGVYGATRVELDALPDITGNYVTVLTPALGFSPEEVELLVTRPIESALGGIPGVIEQRSLSRYGISSVVAVFEDDVDPYHARQMVQERISGVSGELPEGAGVPALGPHTGGLGEIYQFTLRSPLRTQAELYELAELEISPLLKTVRGVVEVNTWGGAVRTLDVVLDPIAMDRRGLTFGDVERGLETAVGTRPAATLDRGANQSFVRARALPNSAGELAERFVVGEDAERGARIAEIGRVEEGQKTRLGTATQNGRGETVYVMVQMLRGANALAVVDSISERMETVRSILPDDVKVDVVYDRSRLVWATLRTVFGNLIEGGILVVAVLFLLLGSLRAGLLVASSIPLSMLGAAAGMLFFGIPGNLMSLGAIDFGLLVDGAVVMTESVFHSAHDERYGKTFRERVASVSVRMARPVFFSVLIILLVYVPVLSLSGVEGKMFRPMAATVILALSTSLLLVLTFVPAAAVTFLRPRDVPEKEPRLVAWARHAYRPTLRFVVARPWVTTGGAVALLLLGLGLFARAGTTFVPQLDEGDLVIQTTRAPDISIESAARAAQHMETLLLENIPEVERVASRIGSPAVATDIMGLEQADVFVNLRPASEWRDGLSKEALVDEISSLLEERDPSAELGVTQPIQMRFNELIGGEATDVSVSVFGPELVELRRIGEEVAAKIAQQPGAEDVRVLAPPELPLIDVSPRFLDAQRAGISPEEISKSVASIRAGVEVGATYEGRLKIPIRIRTQSESNVEALARFPIPTRERGLMPLSGLATVTETPTSALVNHQDGRRRIVVGFNVRGASLGEVAESARAALDASLDLPAGYRVEWGGQYATLAEAKVRLGIVIPVTLLGIALLLGWTFKAVRPAFLILLNVPFAGVGGMIALAVRGLPVSVSAGIGFIALSGIAVLNGVVLMNEVIHLEESGVSSRDAMLQAAESRMRPVLMTALVAALGFVPMMLAHGVGAEVQRPLATVVVGGLVTSTLLTLVILPSVYVRFLGGEEAA